KLLNMNADYTFENESNNHRKSPEMDKAREFLRRTVGPGPISVADMHRQREAEKLSDETVKRAKKIEGIESFRTGEVWYWRYPPIKESQKGCTQEGQEGQEGQESQGVQVGH